jgi:hypothetical protein
MSDQRLVIEGQQRLGSTHARTLPANQDNRRRTGHRQMIHVLSV